MATKKATKKTVKKAGSKQSNICDDSNYVRATMEALEKRAIQALQQTWQAIGSDCLQCTQEAEGKDTMSQELVIDCVTSCGYSSGYPAMYGNDDEAVAWLQDQDYETKDRICLAAFPFKNYGW